MLFSDLSNSQVVNGDIAIEINDLCKSYIGETTTHALVSFSAEIQKGEVIVIIGPNGSGKSTLFNTLIGGLQADSGTIRLFGQDLICNV